MEWVGPLILFLLMTVVGLELTLSDFRRIGAAPLAAVGGALGQIALLPLVTWAVVRALDVPSVVAASALIVAASPPAGMSNVLVAVARANIALSVTLTAATSALCAISLPAVSAVGLRGFLGESVDVEVPVSLLITQLGLSVLVPIAIGMAVRARRPEFAARNQRRIQRVVFVAVSVLSAIAISFADTGELGFADVRQGLVTAAVWTLAAMATGWGAARILGLPPDDRFTFLIDFSARNIAVAAIVAMSGLGRLDLALFAAAYAAVGYPLVVLAALGRRWLVPPARG